MIFPEKLQCFLVTAIVNQGNVSLNAHMGRACCLARCRTMFFNGIGAGHALRVKLECRLSVTQAFIEQVRCFYGTGLGAFSASRTLVHFNVARILAQLDCKITHVAGNLFDFR